MPTAESFRFPKRALALFKEWKRADSPPSLAAVLAEIQDTLTERIERQIRDLQWSQAETVSDAYQELQHKALTQRWPAEEYPQLENLARKALVVLRHHILDRARRGKHRRPLDEALSAYADSRQPSEDFEARETAALVHLAVDSLKPDWRDADRQHDRQAGQGRCRDGCLDDSSRHIPRLERPDVPPRVCGLGSLRTIRSRREQLRTNE